MVGAEIEFRQFLLYLENMQGWLLRKLITEPETVIEQTETHSEYPSAPILGESDIQFIVVVADLCVLAPYRIPVFIDAVFFGALYEHGLYITSLIFQPEAKTAGRNHRLSLIAKFIKRNSFPDVH